MVVLRGRGAGSAVGLGTRATLPTVAKSMGLGAAEGALYGTGAGEGTLAERLPGAAVGAGVGAGVGLAAPYVVGALGAGYNAVKDPMLAALNVGNTNRASRAVGKVLNRSGKTMDDVLAEMRQAGREGQPEFVLADATGHAGQRALSGQARRPGDARQEIIDFLERRQAGQGDRVGAMLSDALDAPDSAAARRAALEAERTATGNVNYSAARGNAAPVDVRNVIARIDDRIGPMQGSGVVGDGIDAKLAKYRSRLAAKPNSLAPGETSRELSDFDRVLLLKQDIQDDYGAAARAGRNNEARELKNILSELDTALEAASPAYRGANDTFAAQSRVIDAIDTGTAATKPRVRASDSVPAFNAMTPEQQAAYKAGYADPLLAKIENAAPGVNKARDLTRPKVETELGNGQRPGFA